MTMKNNNKLISLTVVLYLTAAGMYGILILNDSMPNHSARAESIIVDLSGNGNFTRIQDAINYAWPGDTIYVWAGMYNENIVVNKPLTIIGNGTSITIINGSYQGNVVYVTADWVNLTGFTATYSGQQPGHHYEAGIKLDHADNVHIYDIVSIDNDYPIFLNDSHNNLIENSNLSLNAHGTHIINSNNNSFVNNSNINAGNGLWVKNSENIKILNNIFGKKFYANFVSFEINLENAKSAVIRNNKLNYGFYIWGDDLVHWNSHIIDTTNRIKGKSVIFWKNRSGGVLDSNNGQIILANCTGVTVSNCSFDKITYGIILGFSANNKITDNKAVESVGNIYLMHSDKNVVSRNTGKNSNYNLIMIYSDNNTISNNTASGCHSGLYIYSTSNNNEIIQNSFKGNDFCGMYIASSYNNKICRNNVTNNWGGIVIQNSERNYIENNYAAGNSRGILLRNSNDNKIISNNVSKELVGIELEESNSNYVYKNTASWNEWHGISLISSAGNKIDSNQIGSNKDSGIDFSSSNGNTVINNNITVNKIGLSFSSSNFNKIYYNNIISNTQQVVHTGTNYWNNSYREGNYWSDYTGSDDGSGGRIPGDGIGDTFIPHLNVDNYPFVIPSGWIYLRAPYLSGPSGHDGYGNYSISWNPISSATKYVLEEDGNSLFDSPEVVYEGLETQMDFVHKNNGTYYYRIKAQNSTRTSGWSNTISVLIDWLPAVPRNCFASAYPFGNALNITWDPNIDGTREYEIYVKTTGDWKYLKMVLHPGNSYNHTDLEDGVMYHYKIRSMDFSDQYSDYSPEFSGIPADSIAPKKPEGLKAQSISDSTINLSWSPNTDPDLNGYLIYMKQPGGGRDDEYSLINTVTSTDNSYEANGLEEQVTYFFKIKAFDEVPNNSTFSEVACATTPDETAPGAPSGLAVNSVTNSSLTLSWLPNPEHDIVGYNVYRSKAEIVDYIRINTELIYTLEFIDSGLDEDTQYLYKINVVDDFGLASDFSDTISVTTMLNPYPPEINHSMSIIDMFEDTIDRYSINLYFWFKDPNDDPLKFSAEGRGNIKVVINHNNGDVTLIPVQNWNGFETITFYTDDGIFNFSDSVDVNVKPVNDPPDMPEIIQPLDNTVIQEGEALRFSGYCSDPDIANGDYLSYKWESNIAGSLGEGKNLTGILLPAGKHRISLKVTDSNGAIKISSINVTVTKSLESYDETSKSGDKKSRALVHTLVILAVVIIIVITLFFFFRKRKLDQTDPGDAVQALPQPQFQHIPAQPAFPAASQEQLHYPMESQYGPEQSVIQHPMYPLLSEGVPETDDSKNGISGEEDTFEFNQSEQKP
ncbi:MAG: right-handed parallel beta-helix repeat-containing protein [Thermoplasmata archaeon]|nr:MAG: right-handed parallel beta-helix repeat-containing protein [Thermoplasmata archaeon]